MLTRLLPGPAPSPLLLTIWSIALVALVFLPAIAMVAMFSIWWERKVAGHIQSRIGPNRVGPIGLLQSLADGLKLLLKEDLIPAGADHILFRLAPYLALCPRVHGVCCIAIRASIYLRATPRRRRLLDHRHPQHRSARAVILAGWSRKAQYIAMVRLRTPMREAQARWSPTKSPSACRS